MKPQLKSISITYYCPNKKMVFTTQCMDIFAEVSEIENPQSPATLAVRVKCQFCGETHYLDCAEIENGMVI